MKTLQQIKEMYKLNIFDDSDLYMLIDFIPDDELIEFGINIEEEYKREHEHIELTRENILKQLEKDVKFGYKKSIDKRSISACAMYVIVKMWNFILEEGLEDFDNYGSYGIPLFKATAKKYNFVLE